MSEFEVAHVDEALNVAKLWRQGRIFGVTFVNYMLIHYARKS